MAKDPITKAKEKAKKMVWDDKGNFNPDALINWDKVEANLDEIAKILDKIKGK